ncbi:General alpha-glucoside permease [Golovinomyces cichoracearum]|uniref:General alpha-glucoside permease n=1 Tax=Golovinomyces cichoracearum TaxID=62708 RepID=A0A420I8V2_9PEZI|nr:General alpha-glucoside permease [Golovinomyces cichoracearum]
MSNRLVLKSIWKGLASSKKKNRSSNKENLDYEIKIPYRNDAFTKEQLARNFNEAQSKENWKEALKCNPKALMWCCYVLFTCVMWGYDGLASNIVLSIPQFRKDYGKPFEDQYIIAPIWQLILAGGTLIGLLLGGISTGVVANRYGRRPCLFFSYMLTVVGVFLQWFSPGNLPLLFGGKFLTGIPLGVFITIAPTYCSEIAPLALRGAVTSAVNWSIVLGQCLAYFVLRQTQYIPGQGSYLTLFAVQWPFAAFALGFIFWFPESPYHLIAQGQLSLARKNCYRFHNSKFDVEGYLAAIQIDLDNQSQIQTEASYKECFRGTNRIRTLIAISTFFIQSVSGVSWIIGYMAYFLQLGGLSVSESFNATAGLSVLSLVGNMTGWYFIEAFGRRRTALYGSLFLTVSLFMIGISSLIPRGIWAQVFFMGTWSFIFQSTIGSVAWPIISEVSKSSLRGHTQALATITQGVVGAIGGVLLPFAINPDAGNLGGKIGFIYGTILGGSCIGVWYWYPETKGRSFEEIERLFEMDVKPRNFEKTVLES